MSLIKVGGSQFDRLKFYKKTIVSDVPSQQSRFLGDVSGLAEYSDLGVNSFCNIYL